MKVCLMALPWEKSPTLGNKIHQATGSVSDGNEEQFKSVTQRFHTQFTEQWNKAAHPGRREATFNFHVSSLLCLMFAAMFMLPMSLQNGFQNGGVFTFFLF